MNSQVTLHFIQPAEKEILANLLSLYLHELSEFIDGIEMTENGCYEFDALELFFAGSMLYPLFIRVDRRLAGFILLTGAPYVRAGTDYCIQEFFIIKKYRGKGLAAEAVHALSQLYPGRYSLMVLQANQTALRFWRTVYARYRFPYEEGTLMTEEGFACHYHLFQTRREE